MAQLGHDVVLYIPFATENDLTWTLRYRKLPDLECLTDEQTEFEIVPVFLDQKLSLRNCDVTIWQSTGAEDWEKLYPVAKKPARF